MSLSIKNSTSQCIIMFSRFQNIKCLRGPYRSPKAFGGWASHPFVVVYTSFLLWLHTTHFCYGVFLWIVWLNFKYFLWIRKWSIFHQIEVRHYMFHEKGSNGSRPCQNLQAFSIQTFAFYNNSLFKFTRKCYDPHVITPSVRTLKSPCKVPPHLDHSLIRACRRKVPSHAPKHWLLTIVMILVLNFMTSRT